VIVALVLVGREGLMNVLSEMEKSIGLVVDNSTVVGFINDKEYL